jgi:methyl-accepting chemotaxis protein
LQADQPANGALRNGGWLNIRRSVILAGTALVGAVVSSVYFMEFAISEHRVGGEAYQRIVNDKDLIADLIPPPLLPFEAFSMVHAKQIPGRSVQLEKFKSLEQSFHSRLDHWTKQLAGTDDIKWEVFRQELKKRGDSFWEAMNQRVLPSILANSPNADSEIAKLTSEFADFVDYVNNSYAFLQDRSVEVQESSLLNSERDLMLVKSIGILLALLAIALLFVANHLVVKPIARIAGVMSELSAGNQSVSVPMQSRRDEIGEMVLAVNVFKQQAIENSNHREQNDRVIRYLNAGLENMSNGNLSYRIQESFGETLEPLRVCFNDSMSTLQETIATVKVGTDGIKSGTEEIAQASDDLSRRTENQAANLEETAAAVAEITTKVKQTASGAVHARKIVEVTKNEADRSGVIVQKAVSAMQQIEQSSQKITQIISVIDEIAFQTNLLALNAGVEAARAGDAGRGFAVVASEVRALAQRSADAAREIKQLLSTSQDAVGQGVDLVAETGKSLGDIISRVAEINTIVSDIASNAEQQASGLQEVNTAVDQMDQVTQQNASMVEQTTAATRNLTNQSVELAKLVSRFATATSGVIDTAKLKQQLPAQKLSSVHAPAPMAKRAANADPEWQEF